MWIMYNCIECDNKEISLQNSPKQYTQFTMESGASRLLEF